MNTNYPKHVNLIEVGPRDGFQFETRVLPTEFKLDIIGGLVEAGLKQIQVTSFVRPDRVPQMADAEELIKGLPQAGGIDYSALVLNLEGVRRAVRSGLTSVEISILIRPLGVWEDVPLFQGQPEILPPKTRPI